MSDDKNVEVGQPSYEELKAKLTAMEAANKAVENGRTTASNGLSFKVSEKGAVSLYGMGRFPVTLYYGQWMKLLDGAPELTDFLEEQAKLGTILTEKPEKVKNADKSAKSTGLTIGATELALIPGLLAKYQGNAEAQATIRTLKACHDLNGKVPFEVFVEFSKLIG